VLLWRPGARLFADELLGSAVKRAGRTARYAIVYNRSDLTNDWSNLPKCLRRHSERWPRGQAAILATHGSIVAAVGAQCGVQSRDQRRHSEWRRCRLNLRKADGRGGRAQKQ